MSTAKLIRDEVCRRRGWRGLFWVTDGRPSWFQVVMGWGTPWHRRSEGTAVNSGGGRNHPPITAWNHQAEKPGIEEKTASTVPPANFISDQFRGTHYSDEAVFSNLQSRKKRAVNKPPLTLRLFIYQYVMPLLFRGLLYGRHPWHMECRLLWRIPL